MELILPSMSRELNSYVVDPLRHDQYRSVGGLRTSTLGVVTVLVPGSGMPAGEALITLVRTRDGRRTTAGEYRAQFIRP